MLYDDDDDFFRRDDWNSKFLKRGKELSGH